MEDTMALSRDRFIETQSSLLDELFALAPGEEQTRRQFEQVAIETYDCLVAQEFMWVSPFKLETKSAFSFLRYGEKAHSLVPGDLLQKWRDWECNYPKLLERNPQLELHDMLHSISESHDASSWPAGYERRIQEWIDSGDLAAVPFSDRYDIVTPEFFERLRALRRRAGGWLYWDDEADRVVFAPEPEWQKVRAAQEAHAAARAAELRRQQDRERRLIEMVKSAIGNAAFWAELKDREREIERIPAGAPEMQSKLNELDELFELYFRHAQGENRDIEIGELISALRWRAIHELKFGVPEPLPGQEAREPPSCRIRTNSRRTQVPRAGAKSRAAHYYLMHGSRTCLPSHIPGAS
jgi:hypothetical protein